MIPGIIDTVMIRSSFHVLCASAIVLGTMLGCWGSSEDIEYGHEVKGDKHSTGRLKHGKKHGPWTTVENGKTIDITHWRDGVKHGPSRTRFLDDMYMDRFFENGKFHGRYRIFYEPGQIAEIGWYKRGIRTGYWCSWEPDGSMEYIRYYHRDVVRVEDKYPVGECPLTVAEPRHLDPDDQNYE